MSEISVLKKELDILLRRVLLHKATKNSKGQIKCPLTQRFYHPTQLDVCHYIDRKWLGTRWDLDNCVLCSSYSNRFESSMKEPDYRSVHHKKFSDVLGAEKISELENKKQKKFTLFELKELYNCLTSML